MISAIERDQLLAQLGLGLFPITGFTGGATPASRKPVIAQTMPLICAVNDTATAGATGVMNLTAIFLPAGILITNINFLVGGTAEGTGTHCIFGIYDDGRGSATQSQLALLGQTADNTAAAFMAANTNMGAVLLTPFTTTYSGIYYLAIVTVATTMPTIAGATKGSTAGTNALLVPPDGVIPAAGLNASLFYAATAGSALTTVLPNPSGALTVTGKALYGYVS